MERLSSVRPPLFYGAWKPIAWIGGAVAATIAVAVGALLAVALAATLVVIGLMASVLVVFAGLAIRARRTVRRRYTDVLEARHIGGGSWVAYSWDERAR